MATNIFTQTQISASQSQKEVTANEQDVSLKNGIRGLLSKSVAGSSNVTLTEAEAENAIHHYTGAITANINVIVPTASKIYAIYNNTSGAFTLTVKPVAGTGIAVTQSARALLYCDGTNVIDLIAGAGGWQPLDATLTALAALTIASGKLIKGTGADAFATIDVSSFIETLLDDASAAAARATLDAAALATANSFTAKQTFGRATVHTPSVLTDAATIATDASLGNRFRVTLGGNRTLGAPTNPTDGQQCLWELLQDGTGSRTLALATGAGAFIFGTDITSITLTTTASKTDYLTAVYNLAADRWRVVGFTKGF